MMQEVGPFGYAVAELIRLLIGAGLAWAAVATGQVAGPLGAIGIGAAAPVIIGQLTKAIPLAAATGAVRSAPDFPVRPLPGGQDQQRPDPAAAAPSAVIEN